MTNDTMIFFGHWFEVGCLEVLCFLALTSECVTYLLQNNKENG